MNQASPFAAPTAAAPVTPPGPPAGGRSIPRGPAALAAAGLVLVAGGAGAWVLLGPGVADGAARSQPPARVQLSAGPNGSGSTAVPGASNTADVSSGAARNPFVGASPAAGPVSATSPARSSPAAVGPTATSAPSVAPPSVTSPLSPTANPTVVITVTPAARTVTATPSPSPDAVYVYLAGWIAGSRADLRINLLSAQADPGDTVDGVTYVGQSAAGPSGACATVKLAGAASTTEQTVCPNAVVRLR